MEVVPGLGCVADPVAGYKVAAVEMDFFTAPPTFFHQHPLSRLVLVFAIAGMGVAAVVAQVVTWVAFQVIFVAQRFGRH